MAQGQQRDRGADHLTDLRSPKSGAGDDDIGRDPVIAADHGADATACGLDIGHRSAVAEFDSRGTGAVDDELRALRRQCEAVTRGEQTAVDHVPVEHGEELRALFGVDDVGFDAVGAVPSGSAVQVLQPILGGGDLEASDGQERSAPVGVLERGELFDRVLRKLGHRLRRVRGEDESRGVRGRAARDVQRALFDDESVGPAQLREFVGEVGADDAGSDDDDSW